ncbi:MAG TPA: glycosyltransferase family 2 protein, partial [Gemmatimonadales bacterium]|nr:glycosyltransferase family 2 protein [Gemmatimonadales bacterium]
MPTPLVSVVTPVYNTGKYLAECIESVLAQTFTDFEYVILDNASTDDSPEIIARYARRDPRIRVVRNERLLP